MNNSTSDRHHENPQHGFTKSFLKSHSPQRQSNSKFFQDTRIQTCSRIKQSNGTFTAIPFYEKRITREYPTRSTFTSSWSNQVHSVKGTQHAGMGLNKTLTTYQPNLQRSRLLTADYLPPYRNSSVIEMGDRGKRDDKHWKTTYGNSFKGREVRVSNHPGITAFRNKWERHLISK